MKFKGILDGYNQSQAIAPYEDPELARLQREINRLVGQLAKLQQAKGEIEQQILLLHTRHRHELSQLITELLQLRRNNRQQRTAQPEAKPSPTPEPEVPKEEVDDPDVISDRPPKLPPADRRLLKEMFRQASKLCHPDLVAAEYKAEASLIFIELRTAYEEHNLQRVEEIWHMLERGERLSPKPAWGQDKDKLRAEINYLNTRIETTNQEIVELKQSPAYQKLLNIEDWDDYFDELKAELQRKINRLRRKPVKSY